jgi:hypothetical protein
VDVKPISLWDVSTYDETLIGILREHAELIQAYHATENRLFLDYDYGSKRGRLEPRPMNRHAENYCVLEKDIAECLRDRSIRAFHYSRLICGEVGTLRRDGIHLSTEETFYARLAARAAEGLLTSAEVETIHAASPIHNQRELRAGRFWMTSHPIPPDDTLVSELLGHWGGELAYMWLDESSLIAKLQVMGRPRIIEIALPMAATPDHDAHNAATSALRAFALHLGCVTNKNPIDLCAVRPLPPQVVLTVHTEGDPAFKGMGRDYPAGYVDTDLGWWKALTGEEN